MKRNHNTRKMTKGEAAVFLPALVISLISYYARGKLYEPDSYIGTTAMEEFLKYGFLSDLTYVGIMLVFIVMGGIFLAEMIRERSVKPSNILMVVLLAFMITMSFLVGTIGVNYSTQIKTSGNRGLFSTTRLLIDIKKDLKSNDCDVYTVNECRIQNIECSGDPFKTKASSSDPRKHIETVAEFFKDGVSVAKTQISYSDSLELKYKFPEDYESTISVYKHSRFLRGYDTIDAKRPEVDSINGEKFEFPKPPYEKYYIIEHIGDKLVYRHAYENLYDKIGYEETDKCVYWLIMEEGSEDDPDAPLYGVEEQHFKDCGDNEVLDTVIDEPYNIALYCVVDGENTRMSNVFSYKELDRQPVEQEPEYPPYEEFYIAERVGNRLAWRHRFDDYEEFYEVADKYVYWIGFQEGTADEEHDFSVDIAGAEFPMFEYNEAPLSLLILGREAAVFCDIGGKQTRMSNVVPHSEAY